MSLLSWRKNIAMHPLLSVLSCQPQDNEVLRVRMKLQAMKREFNQQEDSPADEPEPYDDRIFSGLFSSSSSPIHGPFGSEDMDSDSSPHSSSSPYTSVFSTSPLTSPALAPLPSPAALPSSINLYGARLDSWDKQSMHESEIVHTLGTHTGHVHKHTRSEQMCGLNGGEVQCDPEFHRHTHVDLLSCPKCMAALECDDCFRKLCLSCQSFLLHEFDDLDMDSETEEADKASRNARNILPTGWACRPYSHQSQHPVEEAKQTPQLPAAVSVTPEPTTHRRTSKRLRRASMSVSHEDYQFEPLVKKARVSNVGKTEAEIERKSRSKKAERAGTEQVPQYGSRDAAFVPMPVEQSVNAVQLAEESGENKDRESSESKEVDTEAEARGRGYGRRRDLFPIQSRYVLEQYVMQKLAELPPDASLEQKRSICHAGPGVAELLALKSGLTVKQVRQWFSNARKRCFK